MKEDAGLIPPFLNQDILKVLIKAPNQMPLYVRREITHNNETNENI
jgi:hypothetical protein